MQKSKKKEWLFLLLVFCFGITSVNAACDNDKLVELSRQANNIKANYEITEALFDLSNDSLMDPDDSEYTKQELIEMGQDAPYGYLNVVKMNVQNITEEVYIRITDTFNSETTDVHYDDTDNGTYSILITDVSSIRKYKIDVYSENPCTVDLLRSLEVITPMHNELYYLTVCEKSDAYYCKEWSTVEIEMTEDEVREKEFKKQESGNQEILEEDNFWEKNKKMIMIISIVAVVGIIIGVGFTMIKRKRSRAI